MSVRIYTNGETLAMFSLFMVDRAEFGFDVMIEGLTAFVREQHEDLATVVEAQIVLEHLIDTAVSIEAATAFEVAADLIKRVRSGLCFDEGVQLAIEACT